MTEREIERCGIWHIATARGCHSGFVSWAKMGPITGDSPISEPGEHVWFEFGATRSEASARLKAELGIA